MNWGLIRYLAFYIIMCLLLAGGMLFGMWLGLRSASAQTTDWDPRLDPLNVTLTLASDCSLGCWRLVSARFEDHIESGGLHHVWAIVQDDLGNQMAGQEWQVAWPGGRAGMFSKPFPEWSDFAMFGPGGCYNPDNGPGPYSAFVVTNGTTDASRSDVVHGLGLPQCQHVSYRLTWRWQPRAWATPTPEPLPELPFHWYAPPMASP